jgi:hypothetical protein
LQHTPLSGAVSALAHAMDSGCDSCRPLLHATEHIMPEGGGFKGYITCAHNTLGTGSARVAVAFLRFTARTTPSAIQRLELDGNQVAVAFSNQIAEDGDAFLLNLGGSYLSGTVGLGTNTRMTLRLNQLCTLTPLVLPARAPAARLETASLVLDGKTIDRCTVAVASGTAVWIPHKPSEMMTTLGFRFTRAGESRDSDVAADVDYEASWTDREPPHPVKLQHRRVEFSWSRDCLTGWLPPLPLAWLQRWIARGARLVQRERRVEWDEICPKATLVEAGASCWLANSDAQHCSYRCAAPASVPAFSLPTPVRFERMGADRGATLKAYGWSDTLNYSGQELASFIASADRKVVVEFPAPDLWRSNRGNEIDHIEVNADTGTPQRIALGTALPRWSVITVPNASCSSQFTVGVHGARTFVAQKRSLAHGNLVLADPNDYQDRFHWALLFGVGFLFPRNNLVAKTERRGEPYLSIGAGAELYLPPPYPGAVELNLLYEPTLTAYGAVQLTSRDQRLISVPYHRGLAEIVASWWGPDRTWQAGAMAGGGLGGPIFPDGDKVGTLRFYWLLGALYRVKPFDTNAWLEVNAGFRWGEIHEFFGTDADGQPISDTFHGAPALTERRMWQIYAALRFRIEFR